MRTQKLYDSCLGFRVEITIETTTEENKPYEYVPASVLCTITEKVECGERKGTFSGLQDDDADSEHLLSGSWRVIEIDFRTICRVLRWEYHFGLSEMLSKELFVHYFGTVTGSHYYEKWDKVYKHNLHNMFLYLGDNLSDGQLFCNMIIEQVRKYESRIKQNHGKE